MQSCRILFASTSGHTEYVVEVLSAYWRSQGIDVKAQRIETAAPEDLIKGDILVLASGTWNTGGIEGQMNPYMHEFLQGKAKDIDLAQKPVAIIALGDDRYFYTCRANEHLRRFVLDHGGKTLGTALLIVNEPYGQEEKVKKWANSMKQQLAISN